MSSRFRESGGGTPPEARPIIAEAEFEDKETERVPTISVHRAALP
jgi:hypothetical protein